jgi:hypothetical protein
MRWTGLIWLRIRALVNTVMNLRGPQNAGKFLNSCTTSGFSRRAQLHEVSITLNTNVIKKMLAYEYHFVKLC